MEPGKFELIRVELFGSWCDGSGIPGFSLFVDGSISIHVGDGAIRADIDHGPGQFSRRIEGIGWTGGRPGSIQRAIEVFFESLSNHGFEGGISLEGYEFGSPYEGVWQLYRGSHIRILMRIHQKSIAKKEIIVTEGKISAIGG